MKRRKRGGKRGVTDRGRPEEGQSPNGGPVRHIPVLLAQVLRVLAPKAGERYIDGTFGAGGYARAILDAARCEMLGLDRDPSAIAAGHALESDTTGRLKLVETSFSHMEDAARGIGWDRVDGVVLDLGVSSMQLDEAARGFSFMRDGPLDMRMSGEGTERRRCRQYIRKGRDRRYFVSARRGAPITHHRSSDRRRPRESAVRAYGATRRSCRPRSRPPP